MELRKKKKTKVYSTDNGGVAVRFYDTEIFNYNLEKHTITLRTDGYFTVTTKQRINQAFQEFGLPYVLWQKDYDWFVKESDTDQIWKFDGDDLTIHHWRTDRNIRARRQKR